MAVAIDTLAYAKRLREAGFTEAQAEGQAHALAEAMTEALATKQDLREFETRIDARFSVVDTRLAEFERRVDSQFGRFSAQLGRDLADLERRMTIRLGGMLFTGIGAVAALVKLI